MRHFLCWTINWGLGGGGEKTNRPITNIFILLMKEQESITLKTMETGIFLRVFKEIKMALGGAKDVSFNTQTDVAITKPQPSWIRQTGLLDFPQNFIKPPTFNKQQKNNSALNINFILGFLYLKQEYSIFLKICLSAIDYHSDIKIQ